MIIIIRYISNALISVLSAHRVHDNLRFVKRSPSDLIYIHNIKHYLKQGKGGFFFFYRASTIAQCPGAVSHN